MEALDPLLAQLVLGGTGAMFTADRSTLATHRYCCGILIIIVHALTAVTPHQENVAIKMMKKNNSRRRMMHEVEVMKNLAHENMVSSKPACILDARPWPQYPTLRAVIPDPACCNWRRYELTILNGAHVLRSLCC